MKVQSLKRNKIHMDYLKQLNEKGIITIPEYLSKDNCKKIIKNIENNMLEPSIKVVNNGGEGIKGDFRIFKFEKNCKDTLHFSEDKFIKKIVSKYFGKKLISHFTVAGKVVYKEGLKSNSGGDWHKDSEDKSLKAMIYLSDVNVNNGPFSIITNSKKLNIARRPGSYNLITKIIMFLKGLPSTPPRFSDSDIKKNKNLKIKTITAKAGTLLIFDGNFTHRGEIIKNGKRYSLTNYYFRSDWRTRYKIKSRHKNLYVK